MKVNLTVRLEPETKQEALDYQKIYAALKEGMEELALANGFEKPRFLLITKRFE